MKCFQCGSEAVAICIYCGRAVCREHAKEGPLVVHGVGMSEQLGSTREWLEIRGAVWCGLCKIKGHGGTTEADKFFTHKEEAELTEKTGELYDRLLHAYSYRYGAPRQVLEIDIESLMKQGLNREEAIKRLAEKKKIIEKG